MCASADAAATAAKRRRSANTCLRPSQSHHTVILHTRHHTPRSGISYHRREELQLLCCVQQIHSVDLVCVRGEFSLASFRSAQQSMAAMESWEDLAQSVEEVAAIAPGSQEVQQGSGGGDVPPEQQQQQQQEELAAPTATAPAAAAAATTTAAPGREDMVDIALKQALSSDSRSMGEFLSNAQVP